MAIITITRGSLSASTQLAYGLAERLGYSHIGRERVIDHGKKYGLHELQLADVSALATHPPSFWDRHAAHRAHYLTMFRASLMDFAVGGNIVYHGNLGQFLLAEVPNLLRIRVDTDFDHRVKFLMDESGRSEAEAQAHIHDVDSRRRKWVKFLYGKDFEESINYDLILNMAKITANNMVDAVEALVRSAGFENSDADLARLADLHLQAVVEAALARSPRTRGMELIVTANAASGEIDVSGPQPMLGTDLWEQDILAVVGKLEGVTSVSAHAID